MTRLAIICARGGSKGVPGKNTRVFNGKPLIAWTVEQAVASDLFDLVAVSSDTAEILKAAKDAGAGLLVQRPAEMATDEASVHPAIQHCLAVAEEHLGRRADSFAFMQVTSPFRATEDVRRAVDLWEQHRPGSVVGVTESEASPYFNLLEESASGEITLSKPPDAATVRRQDAPRCWRINGAVYVFDRTRYDAAPQVLFSDTRVLAMPPERSIDIDTEFDWQLAEALVQMRRPA